MQGVAALGHVDDVLAMQGVVGDGAAQSLADAQAIGVVKEGGRGAGFGHLLQLAALFPGVGPGAVGEGIADGIRKATRKYRGPVDMVIPSLKQANFVLGQKHSSNDRMQCNSNIAEYRQRHMLYETIAEFDQDMYNLFQTHSHQTPSLFGR